MLFVNRGDGGVYSNSVLEAAFRERMMAEGYLVTTLQGETGTTVQLLAADYDVDINHELDSIRNHRSRVNLLTSILPAGTDDTVTFRTEKTPTVYTPFCEGDAALVKDSTNWTLSLPKDCTYALIHLA